MKRITAASPGAFSVQAAADSRRLEFDLKNEAVLSKGLPVECVFIGDSIIHHSRSEQTA